MFCRKCGTQISDNAKFCPNCGESVGPANVAGNETVPFSDSEQIPDVDTGGKTPKSRRTARIILLVVIIAAAAVVAAFFVTRYVQNRAELSPEEHMERGIQYLDDEEYEEAVAEFTAALDVEPNMQAYRYLADAYLDLSESENAGEVYDEAVGYALDTYEQTGELPEDTEDLYEAAQNYAADYEEVERLDDLGDVITPSEEIKQTEEDRKEEEKPTTVWVKATETNYEDSEMTGYIEYSYDDNHLLVSEITYDAPGGNIKDTVIYEYDDNGNLTLEEKTDSQGFGYRYEYTYDEKGNMTSQVEPFSYGGEERHDYAYDENDNMISEVYTDEDGYVYSYEYTYDQNGNKLSGEETGPEGVEFHIDYTYDENNNMISEDRTDRYGTGGLTEYTYDENGNMTSKVSSGESIEYTYDENGNMTSEDTTESDGSWGRSEYTYDENGNMTSAVYTHSTGEEERHEYTYDEKDNLLSEVTTYSTGGGAHVEYTYDENGNMTSLDETIPTGNRRSEYTYESYKAPAE